MCLGRSRTIGREPAASPVHAVYQVQLGRLILLPLRGRSRDKVERPVGARLPAICREPAARPVHAGYQVQPSRLILLPLRSRSRDKPRYASGRIKSNAAVCF